MTDAYAMLLVGALGVLTAFVERRDGWRHVALAREVSDLRERVTLLERDRETAESQTEPRPWWAFWRRP